MTELWLPIPGFEDFFEASNLGNIRTVGRLVPFTSKKGGRFLRWKRVRPVRFQLNNNGYLIAHLTGDKIRWTDTVHAFVALTFIGPVPKGKEICHENGNRTDNRADNLRYDTRSNNRKDMIAHGTVYAAATGAKLTQEEVLDIRAAEGAFSAEYLASRLGVQAKHIQRIWDRKLWRYL